MSEIEILIDPNSPAHAELERGVRESLRALTSISVKEDKRPVPPGTLAAGLDQVVAFVVQHPDKAVLLATAVLNTLNNLLRFRSTKSDEGDKAVKPLAIAMQGETLPLPASESAQKRFLRKIAGPRTDAQRGNVGRNPKVSATRRKTVRPKTRKNVRKRRK